MKGLSADVAEDVMAEDVSVPSRLHLSRLVLLKAAEKWYSMSQAMGLRHLRDLVQGTTSLSESPVWLLGIWYGILDKDTGLAMLPAEVVEALKLDFQGRIWITYRKEFEPIGSTTLTSDVGWGCTLRSGQMLLAETLLRHTTGRCPAGYSDATTAGRTRTLIELFLDSPRPSCLFSIHNLCTAGGGLGVIAGHWLGPWTLCKCLEESINRLRPYGLVTHVACDPGGGAPTLHMAELVKKLQGAEGQQSSPVMTMQCGMKDLEDPHGPKEMEEFEFVGGSNPISSDPVASQPGLLLLIPVTLGVERLNSLYIPQLQEVLTYPQTVGIVGGRPGSSLYFIGYQDQQLLYLDPHEAQQVALLPGDLLTYSCDVIRLTPLASIDPSLAIGFYCSNVEDVRDLMVRLSNMSSRAGVAPLLTVEFKERRLNTGEGADVMLDLEPGTTLSRGGEGEGDWELL